MIKREELNGKDLNTIQQELQALCADFQAQAEQMTVEELNSAEAELVTIMNDYDAQLVNTKYELSKSIEYGGEKYTKSAISVMIIDFINRMEVDWQYTLGMYELVRLWQGIGTKITYKEYDSTLRVLGQVKYKGYDDWKHILAVNEFLMVPQEAYARDNVYMAYLAELHNIVINKLNAPAEGETVIPISELEDVPVINA